MADILYDTRLKSEEAPKVIILKFDLFNKILYNKLNKNLKGGIFYDSN